MRVEDGVEVTREQDWLGAPVIAVLNDEVTVSIDAADYAAEVLASIGDAVADDEGERLFELVITMAVADTTRVITLGARISEALLERLPSIFAAHALR